MSSKLVRSILLLCVGFTPLFGENRCDTNRLDPRRFAVSLQYCGITFHPRGGSLPERFPRKFDSKAYFVAEMGIAINGDFYLIPEKLFLRYMTAHYRDCANLPAGFEHLGIRGRIFEKGNHSVNGGMGITLVYRKDWHQFPEYKEEAFYKDRVKNGWQYRILPYGGEFEYLYKLNDVLSLQYSLIPGIPYIMTSKIGVRYRF